MIFVPLLVLGIALYFSDKRILSGAIFFFFMSNGFQFIPESLFDTGVVISKSSDFALLYVLCLFVLGCIRYRDFIVFNKLSMSLFCFLAFVGISMLYSRFHLHVAWSDIIKTARPFFFVLAYFVFRRLSKDEILEILKIAFIITIIGCTIYVIQSIVGRPLLAGTSDIGEFGALNRYYNIPVLFYVFVGYSFFFNPLKGFWKYYSIIVFCLATIVSQHRGLMIAILIGALWGIYIIEGGIKGIFKYLLIGGLLLLPVLSVILDRFSVNTSKDIDSVLDGAFTEYSQEMSVDGTFLFRMALLYERWEYVEEDPLRILMGVGFMTEGSRQTTQEFDFVIGLSDKEDRVIQLDTSDIAWLPFMLRLGFLGTFIYIGIYMLLAIFFYQHRRDPLMLSFLIFIVLLFVNSISSVELYSTQMIIPALMVYIVKELELDAEGEEKLLEEDI